ncbi:MAG: hypothetical protein AB7F22_25595 [Reyranella sp.]|uniref:hypothetical protein n=1 Tax=Reyranella sp. TaxID=1929291 RepID=UPI003D0D2437
MYKIERGHEPPARKSAKYPFSAMQPSDRFTIPCTAADMPTVVNRARSAFGQWTRGRADRAHLSLICRPAADDSGAVIGCHCYLIDGREAGAPLAIARVEADARAGRYAPAAASSSEPEPDGVDF